MAVVKSCQEVYESRPSAKSTVIFLCIVGCIRWRFRITWIRMSISERWPTLWGYTEHRVFRVIVYVGQSDVDEHVSASSSSMAHVCTSLPGYACSNSTRRSSIDKSRRKRPLLLMSLVCAKSSVRTLDSMYFVALWPC